MESQEKEEMNVGDKFGHWTVLDMSDAKRENEYKVKCKCSCGKIKHTRKKFLKNGRSCSCGCMKNYKHGHTVNGGRTREYTIWESMRHRCNNQRNDQYPSYGGRGIKVCKRWEDFSNFLQDMGECPNDHTLDRIDNDGDYEPGNCRWATRLTQANNTRRNRFVESLGETKTVAQWARDLGVSRHLLRHRLNKGVTIEQMKGRAE